MKGYLALAASILVAACASTHHIEPQVAGSSIDFHVAETVKVELSSFRFSPAEIDLEAGRPYVLKLVNTASGGHDFTAPEFFAAARVAPADAVRLASGQVELDGGETVSIHLVPSAGEYKIACTHFGHVALGMTGKIIVR